MNCALSEVSLVGSPLDLISLKDKRIQVPYTGLLARVWRFGPPLRGYYRLSSGDNHRTLEDANVRQDQKGDRTRTLTMGILEKTTDVTNRSESGSTILGAVTKTVRDLNPLIL